MCWPKLLCYLRAFSLISGGRRWNRISDTLPGQLIVLTVIAHPANPNIVYASTSGGIYVSQNAGAVGCPYNLRTLQKAPAVLRLLITSTARHSIPLRPWSAKTSP